MFKQYLFFKNLFFFLQNISIKTSELKPKFHLSTCKSDRDCQTHGWCKDGDCECEKGWLTWRNSRQCSYKQSFKDSCFYCIIYNGNYWD